MSELEWGCGDGCETESKPLRYVKDQLTGEWIDTENPEKKVETFVNRSESTVETKTALEFSYAEDVVVDTCKCKCSCRPITNTYHIHINSLDLSPEVMERIIPAIVERLTNVRR